MGNVKILFMELEEIEDEITKLEATRSNGNGGDTPAGYDAMLRSLMDEKERLLKLLGMW